MLFVANSQVSTEKMKSSFEEEKKPTKSKEPEKSPQAKSSKSSKPKRNTTAKSDHSYADSESIKNIKVNVMKISIENKLKLIGVFHFIR